MNFLIKIENMLNAILLKIGAKFLNLVPHSVRTLVTKFIILQAFLLKKLKGSPAQLKLWLIKFLTSAKSAFTIINLKVIFVESYKKGMADARKGSDKKFGKIRTLFLAPFLILKQWFHGLSMGQSLLLLSFSGASMLAVVGISFSSQRIADKQSPARVPASVEETVKYERPDYYKKQTRHFDLTNLRLPIYSPKINEVRSIDIDFTATTSNRKTRMILEKLEFNLRDHLILEVEPSIASFPLEEEGKEIIRKKLIREINAFIKANDVEGEITELKITYMLAN